MGDGKREHWTMPRGTIRSWHQLTSRRKYETSITEKLNLKLTKTRTFSSGKVYLCYEPMA
jgi:hypothetical protein